SVSPPSPPTPPACKVAHGASPPTNRPHHPQPPAYRVAHNASPPARPAPTTTTSSKHNLQSPASTIHSITRRITPVFFPIQPAHPVHHPLSLHDALPISAYHLRHLQHLQHAK